MSYTQELGKRAKAAEAFISSAPTMQKNKALAAISKALIENSSLIIAENAKDIAAAKENGMSEAKQDRLMLDASRIEGIAKGVDQIIALGDPYRRDNRRRKPSKRFADHQDPSSARSYRYYL